MKTEFSPYEYDRYNCTQVLSEALKRLGNVEDGTKIIDSVGFWFPNGVLTLVGKSVENSAVKVAMTIARGQIKNKVEIPKKFILGVISEECLTEEVMGGFIALGLTEVGVGMVVDNDYWNHLKDKYGNVEFNVSEDQLMVKKIKNV